MNNKISGSQIDRYVPASRPAASTASSGSRSVSTDPPVARADAVSLTDDALLLQEASRAVAAAADIDPARIERIRQQLADGSYQIDAGAIAAKLMKTEWELFK